MKNFVHDGEVITVTAPYARTSGQGVQVGTALFGICAGDIANGAIGEIMVEGAFDLDKVSAQAWAAGDKIYWDNTAKLATSVSSTNLFIGVAIAAAANPTSTGRLRLSAMFS